MDSRVNTARRVPPNFFAMGFGIAGLCVTWRITDHYGYAPATVGDALAALSAVAWLIVLLAYLRGVIADPAAFRQDLADPVMAPFLSLTVITPMLLSVVGVAPFAPEAGKVLFDAFLVLTLLLGGWLTGQWMSGTLELDKLHPGYFLPTAAGGLLGSDGAALVGQHFLAEVMFGFGAVSWLITATIVLGRLYLRPQLPPALIPTLSIMIAPPCVATLAWSDNHGGGIDAVMAFLGGFAMLMVLAQVRLVPAYLRLHFMPSTWAFAFSWSAAASAGMYWLNDTRPAGHRAEEYALLAANTVLVTAVAARTLIALYRRQLLPPATLPAPASAGQRIPAMDVGEPAKAEV
jgi:tellurite resistance protein